MSYQIEGQIKTIFPTQEKEHNGKKYYSRDFIIEVCEEINGNTFSNYPKFTAKGFERCQNLDTVNVGAMAQVSFNVRGVQYIKDNEEKNFTSLEAWRLLFPKDATAPQQQSTASTPLPQKNNINVSPEPETIDDLPF